MKCDCDGVADWHIFMPPGVPSETMSFSLNLLHNNYKSDVIQLTNKWSYFLCNKINQWEYQVIEAQIMSHATAENTLHTSQHGILNTLSSSTKLSSASPLAARRRLGEEMSNLIQSDMIWHSFVRGDSTNLSSFMRRLPVLFQKLHSNGSAKLQVSHLWPRCSE